MQNVLVIITKFVYYTQKSDKFVKKNWQRI